ncbi:AAA family ATPase [Chitinophaga polysaccharea]|uniref:AAA domain-containing protein n=1 Tax=Chitinophaga TaxID=79328 RepID=UPI001455357D|nr:MULTISPECIES: AAA domain-containing protein [Chitinophaga]NLR62635.1 AAA family ATPase [Chitinophaga polysaccharea]NLU91443.1 AAA family ATPase [Chitinophaga sp. Ak27]
MDYFKKQLDLLKTEREVDRKSYQQMTESTSVAERRANGLSWYPIAIRGSEMSRGDYLTVEIERTTHQDIPHQLRFGASAVLFSNHNRKDDHLDGTISYQSGNRLKITLRTDELPDWANDGKLGIDLLFDDNSYDEMQSALKQADALPDKDPSARLVKILTGETAPAFHTNLPAYTNPALNASQQAAVQKILTANDLAIVHGPPGTGKTTTLVQAIKALIRQDGRQILVVAPSNTAVDLLSEKLSDEGLNVLRVGNPARVSERLMSLTLDSKISEHPSVKEIKRLKKQANEFRDMAHKYKRNFGKAEREQRKALFDEARKIMKEVGNTEQYIIDDLIAKAQVITATLVGANHYTVKSQRYHTVVIDEAGQALEPACWIPILKAQKVVLAGDHCQLSPTIKSDEAARKGLSTTLLEKCTALYPESVTLLEEQYRMHETIMGYSSRIFYGDKLKAHASVASHLLFSEDSPLSFVDTAGCGFDEKLEGTSTTNPEEAVFLFKHLTQLVVSLGMHYQPKDFPTVAVISPYKQQIQLLKEQLQHSPALQPYADKISVNTIDSFQGQERDIVYISMTRSNTENNIGFLSDTRRMNVAMTRARKKLVVIGDSGTLSGFGFYASFISYAESKNAYQSAWEFMDI